MPVLMYLLMFFLLSDLTKLILFLFGKKIVNFNLYSTGISLLLCTLLMIYGALHARTIKTVNYSLTLPGSGSDIHIVLLSDLHIGSTIGKTWVKRAADSINKAQPDMICFAGDIFDGNTDTINDLDGVISVLNAVKAPLGVYAVLGNHDVDRMSIRGGSTERIEEILEAAGIVLLMDEVHQVRENLFIAGRRDARPIGMNVGRKTAKELLAGIEGTIVMLDHQPASFTQTEQAGADLVLCGHTHSGQFFPANLVTRSIFKKADAVSYGLWKGKKMQAVVTSGAGVWGPPVRIGTNSEIAVINIEFVP